jgi:hypothetical protein
MYVYHIIPYEVISYKRHTGEVGSQEALDVLEPAGGVGVAGGGGGQGREHGQVIAGGLQTFQACLAFTTNPG